MKKLICAVLALALAVCAFSGCTGAEKKSDKLSIVTTIFPYYDLTERIAGDKADVTMLISPGSEPHNFEPTPKDIVKIKEADLFIYNGGESDEWVENILGSVGSKVRVIKMFDHAELLPEEDINHNEGDESDEHIWTSIGNMTLFVDPVTEELEKLDKNNAKYFAANAEEYKKELGKLESSLEATVEASAKKPIVIADRFPLLYLFKQFGIEFESAFPGCTSETQPSPKTVAKLSEFVKDNNISVVFKIDTSSDSLGKTILGGDNVKTLYSLHNVTKEQFDKKATYISLMELNADALKEALG